MKRLLPAVLAACWLAACSVPVLKGPPPFDAPSALKSLAARAEALRSVEAEAKLEYKEGAKIEWATLVFSAARPCYLSLEVLAPTGLVAAASSDEESFRFYDARHDHAYAGRPTAEALGRVLAVRFDPEEGIPLLLAAPAPLAQALTTPVEADRELGLWRLTQLDEAGHAVRFYFFSDGRLARVRRYAEGALQLEAIYLDWRTTAKGESYPRIIKLRHGSRPDTLLTLKLRELSFNAPLDLARYHLPFPPGRLPDPLD